MDGREGAGMNRKACELEGEDPPDAPLLNPSTSRASTRICYPTAARASHCGFLGCRKVEHGGGVRVHALRGTHLATTAEHAIIPPPLGVLLPYPCSVFCLLLHQ